MAGKVRRAGGNIASSGMKVRLSLLENIQSRQLWAISEPESLRTRPAHDQEPLRAGTWHDAVEQPNRIGNRPRIQIFLQGESFLEQGARISQCVVALGDAETCRSPP